MSDGTTVDVGAVAAAADADAAIDEAARALAQTHVEVSADEFLQAAADATRAMQQDLEASEQDEVAAMATEVVDASAVERELDVLEEGLAQEEAATQESGIPGGVSIAAKIAQVKAERAARGASAEGESFGEATVKAATKQLAGEMAAAPTKHTTVVVGSDGGPLAQTFQPAPKAKATPGRKPKAATEPLNKAEREECRRLELLGDKRSPAQAQRYRALVTRRNATPDVPGGTSGKGKGKSAPVAAPPVVDAAAVEAHRLAVEAVEKKRQEEAEARQVATEKLLAAQKEAEDAARKRTEEAADTLTKIDAQRALLSVQHRDALSKALEMIDAEIAVCTASLGALDALRVKYAPPAPVVAVTTKKGAGTGTGGQRRTATTEQSKLYAELVETVWALPGAHGLTYRQAWDKLATLTLEGAALDWYTKAVAEANDPANKGSRNTERERFCSAWYRYRKAHESSS